MRRLTRPLTRRRREAKRRLGRIRHIRWSRSCSCVVRADIVVGLWRDTGYCALHGGMQIPGYTGEYNV